MARLTLFYVGLVHRHPVASAIVVAAAVGIFVAASRAGHMSQAATYLSALALSVIVIDTATAGRLAPPVPVRQPRGESIALVACWVIACLWLVQRFVFNYRPSSAPVRLLWVALGLGCVFAIVPAIVLLSLRYGPRDLGLRWSGVPVALPIIAIFGVMTWTLSPRSMTWTEIRQNSALDIAVLAFSAAVPEEFFRIAWQTRVGAWARSPAAGWLIASFAWALLHGPKDFGESRSFADTALGVVNIIPLGLMWGYLTHRTGSIIPSILLHATNIWGLQNL